MAFRRSGVSRTGRPWPSDDSGAQLSGCALVRLALGSKRHRRGEMDCLFCQRFTSGDIAEANAHAVSFADGYPVAAGHTLVVPRRHLASVFDLEAEEYAALWALVAAVRARLAASMGVCGFTVGVNDGGADGGPRARQGDPAARVTWATHVGACAGWCRSRRRTGGGERARAG